MIFPILQSQIQIFSKPDPGQNTIAIVVMSAVLALFLLWAIITMRTTRKPGTYSRRAFRKNARKLGLSKEHIRFLENLIRELHFLSPMRVLENSTALDRLLRKAMSYVENQEELTPAVKENRRHMIYAVKQTIEANSDQHKIISSTLSLPINTEVQIRTREGYTYDSFITSNMQNMMGLECPATGARAKEYPWPKGEDLAIFFIRGGTEVYAYRTKVLGYKIVRGVLSVFTEHGKNLKQIQKRRSKRREIGRPAIFYPVDIVESGKGRKAVRQAVVNRGRRFLGNLQDLSAGGCAVQTQNPLQKASLIKVDFETVRGRPVTVYGKVKGTTPWPPRSTILHVQFTNVSRLHMNTIRDYVYEYVDLDEE